MRRTAAFLLSLALLAVLLPSGLAETELYQAPKQITVTFTGDCTLGVDDRERGKDTGFETFIQKYGYEYPFEKVRSIFEQDDLTVINLEGTFYDYDANRAKKTYAFRGPTDYISILTSSSIEACSLGNNHSMDYGAAGMQSTIETLEGAGIGWFGRNEAICQHYIYEKDGIRIGFVSMYVSDWVKISDWTQGFDAMTDYVAKLKAEGVNLIIGCLHGGVEYDVRYDKNGGQEKLANRMIAAGADIVVGNHPHTVQGIRVENGRTTLWSLGNFSFGGNSEIKKNAMGEYCYGTYIAQFTFSFDENNRYLGHQLNIIPCVIGYEKDSRDAAKLRNLYQPYPATGKEAEQVMNAIRRDRTPLGLKLNPFVEGVGALQDFVPAPTDR